MEDFEKQVVFFSISLIIGLAIVLSGASVWLHDNVKELSQPLFDRYNEESAPLVAESVGYAAELLLATIIMLSPMSAISSPWFFKVAYDLVIGRHAQLNVFVVDPILNFVMAAICITLLIYSLYNQYTWTVKLIQPGTKGTDDEIARLI